MRRSAVLAALACVLSIAPLSAALAETDSRDRDIDACGKIADSPPESVIAACGRLLGDPEVRYSWRKETVATIYGNRAFAYRRQQSYPAALNDLNSAIGLVPSYHFGLVLRGRVHADMGSHQAAIADFTRCLRVKPRDDVCYQFRGQAHMRLGNAAMALRDLNMAIGIEPTNAAAHGIRGVVYDNMGQRQAAIRDYRKAVQLGVQSDVVQRRLAELEAGAAPSAPAPGTGDSEQFRQACFNPPNPQAGIIACTRRIQAGGGADSKEQSDSYNTRAWWRYKAGQYRIALPDADRAIALDPGSAPAYDTRGHIYRMLGRRDAAIGDFRQALALNPRADTRRSAQDGLRALGVAVSHPPGTPVNLTWRFRNNTGGSVQVKMYARQRGIWWPTATTNWRMDGVGPYSFTISCRAGEKVCYGAWAVGNTDRYWGAGFQDRHGCESCCYACFEGQTTLYNLNR